MQGGERAPCVHGRDKILLHKDNKVNVADRQAESHHSEALPRALTNKGHQCDASVCVFLLLFYYLHSSM